MKCVFWAKTAGQLVASIRMKGASRPTRQPVATSVQTYYPESGFSHATVATGSAGQGLLAIAWSSGSWRSLVPARACRGRHRAIQLRPANGSSKSRRLATRVSGTPAIQHAVKPKGLGSAGALDRCLVAMPMRKKISPHHLAHRSKPRHTAASEIRPKAAIASRETVTI